MLFSPLLSEGRQVLRSQGMAGSRQVAQARVVCGHETCGNDPNCCYIASSLHANTLSSTCLKAA